MEANRRKGRENRSRNPMSGPGGAIVSSAGKQLVTLGTRLIVGINLVDTILHIPPSTHRISQYRLRPYLKYFSTVLHKFKCDVTIFSELSVEDNWLTLSRLRHEIEPLEPTFHPVPLSRTLVMRNNMVEKALLRKASELMTPSTRILFIDAECDIKFNALQTLVVDRYVPVKRIRNSDQDPTVTPEQKKLALTVNDYTLVALAELIKDLAASNVPESMYAKPEPRPSVIGSDGKEKPRKVAVGIAVDDFLRLEPLVEKINVPMHGIANYLPMENCDHMDCIDLDKLEVSEPLIFDDVKETDEHRQMFK